MKPVHIFLIVIVVVITILICRNGNNDNESFWHGPRWGWGRWGGWGRPRWNWNESDGYLNCIRNHSSDPNRDEKCCQIVFGTSCDNI